MMGIVFLNIRELWNKQRVFLIILILVQALSAFCLIFIVGVIINNQLYSGMDYITDYFYISFEENVKYNEVEDTIKDIFDNVLKSAAHSFRIHAEYKSILIWTDASIENGRYVYGPFLYEMLDAQLESGRKPTEEELNSEDCVAVVLGISDNTLRICGEDYEIIGRRAANDGSVEQAFVGPRKLYKLSLRDLKIRLNRYLTQKEIDSITEKLDQVIAGRYRISDMGKADDEGDIRAVLRAVILSCILIAFVLAGTLTMLYQHIMDKRKYKLAVFRLTGCSAWACVKYFMAEMAVVSIPSLGIGLGVFYILQKLKLNKIYPYMELYLDYKMYVGLFVGMLVVLNILMLLPTLIRTLRPIKKQLLASKE
jgi:hypothetical protein